VKFPCPALALAISLLAAQSVFSAIVGTNTPSEAVTAKRIATLPRTERAEWSQYLAHSERQWKADQEFLRRELKRFGTTSVIVPPPARGASSLPLGRDSKWYATADARRLADITISFQTPAGGWSKNLDFSRHVRATGEHFVPENASHFLAASDNDAPRDSGWSYVGTFDNDATTTQLRFLARVIRSLDKKQGAPYRAAFSRGLNFIFAAQYPNGGWPQVWPLQGGYHDAITYNDGAMLQVLALLRDVAEGKNDFTFIAERVRRQARERLQRGMDCLLHSQVIVNGRRTVWGQQHDALTLQPTSARNYEMPSLASGESADITLFLMQMTSSSDEVVGAINDATAWFTKTQLRDVAFRNVGNQGRQLISDPGSGPLWSRYYEIGSDRPVFGDRDKSIHDEVNEISFERRRGYAWFTDKGNVVLQSYAKWKAARPQ